MPNEVMSMMVDMLKDAYSAEKQALRAMQRMQRQVTSDSLRQCFEMHREQTEGQIERLDRAFEMVGARPGRKVCEAMRGLIEEATHEMEEHDKGPAMDVLITAAQQKIEHYEIAAYGTMAALAKAAGQQELAALLQETLEEEKQTDLKLTEVAEREVNPAFLQGMQGDAANDQSSRGRSKKSA